MKKIIIVLSLLFLCSCASTLHISNIEKENANIEKIQSICKENKEAKITLIDKTIIQCDSLEYAIDTTKYYEKNNVSFSKIETNLINQIEFKPVVNNELLGFFGGAVAGYVGGFFAFALTGGSGIIIFHPYILTPVAAVTGLFIGNKYQKVSKITFNRE